MRKCNAKPKRIYREILQSTKYISYLKTNIALCAIMALGACAHGVAKLDNPPIMENSAQFILTTPDKTNLLTPQAQIKAQKAPIGNFTITIDENLKFQSFIGAGAAITDASAHLIQNKLDENARNQLMRELFSPNEMGFSFTRLTIGASDFSLNHYSLDDMPKGQKDNNLANFNLGAMPKEILPSIKSAIALNPDLKIMATPWSAPAWMKTNDNLIGGTLAPQSYGVFANYLLKYSDEMQKQGVKIDFLSVQNEPHFSPANYPGMKLSDDVRAEFLKNHLGPKLNENSPKIFEWDHNWDEFDAPLNVLKDQDANKYLNAVAWHCYGGNVSAQSKVKQAFPDKDVYFTECSGGEWAKDWNDSFGWQVENLIIGTSRNWAKGILLWNIALDENFGPHAGGCGDCRGVVTINSQNGQVTRNLEYYALGHISKFVKVGATRISSSEMQNNVHNVAFQNPDGSKVLIIANRDKVLQSFSIANGVNYYNLQLPSGSAASIIIPK
jgi:glucosylceramidase